MCYIILDRFEIQDGRHDLWLTDILDFYLKK
jgi:hypothetical protein